MPYEGDAWASESSDDLGSDTVALVRMADVLAAVKQAREEQKTLLQQARDEQKMHTAKVIRAISDMMVLGVATLIVVIVLCTFVLYTKPSVNTTCDPVVNHKWEPPVNHTTCEPVNHTTCEPPVNHTKCAPPVNHTKCAPCEPPVNHTKWEPPDTHNISDADQKFIIGAVVVGPSLSAIITAAVVTALGY